MPRLDGELAAFGRKTHLVRLFRVTSNDSSARLQNADTQLDVEVMIADRACHAGSDLTFPQANASKSMATGAQNMAWRVSHTHT